MNSEDRGSVFASLRKIYDGMLTKEFGTSAKGEAWEGRITVVVGTTPEIDRYRSVNQSLGERFVRARSSRRSACSSNYLRSLRMEIFGRRQSADRQVIESDAVNGKPGRNRQRQGEAVGRSRVADDFRASHDETHVEEW
jgi:hypothetical protein